MKPVYFTTINPTNKHRFNRTDTRTRQIAEAANRSEVKTAGKWPESIRDLLLSLYVLFD